MSSPSPDPRQTGRIAREGVVPGPAGDPFASTMAFGGDDGGSRRIIVAHPDIALTDFLAEQASHVQDRLPGPPDGPRTEVVRATTPEALRALLRETTPRLALLHATWIDPEAEATLQQAAPRIVWLPIVPGRDEQQKAWMWVQRGAAGVIPIPFVDEEPAELLSLLRTATRSTLLPIDEAATIQASDIEEPAGRELFVSLPSRSAAIDTFLRIFDALPPWPAPIEERRLWHLAISEIGMNAVEWGNGHDPTKRVEMRLTVGEDAIRLRIADEGPGFAPEAVPDPTADPTSVLEARRASGKRLGGYGLALVRNLVDRVRFREGGRICVLDRVRSDTASGAGE